MKKIIDWIKTSFEGADGKASYRRLTTFTFVVLACYMIFGDKITDTNRLYAYYATLVMIATLIGIVTTADVLKFLNRNSANNTPPSDIIKAGDQVTITKEE